MNKTEALLNHCLKYGFLTNVSNSNLHKHQYGALGSVMFNDLLNEWKKFVLIKEPNMYFLQNTMPHINSKPKSFENLCENIHLLNNKKAQYGICQLNAIQSLNDNGSDLFKFYMKHLLTTYYFCTPRSISSTQEQFKTKRLAWWKQYLGTPSDIGFKHLNYTSIQDINKELNPYVHKKPINADNHNIGFAITYKFPWGEDVVETITREIYQEEDAQQDKHVIHISTSVEEFMRVFLTDAYSIKTPLQTSDPTSQVTMRLHPKITPFKLSLLTKEEPNKSPNHNLVQVAKLVLQEMAKESIYTYDLTTADHVKNHEFHALLTRSDHIGVPYNLILEETLLENGMLYLRNRDTTLTEEVHISEIRKVIPRYINAY